MRSFFLVGGLACLAGILFVKGYLLKPAGTEVRFEYTEYDDEAPPPLPRWPQKQPEDSAPLQPQEQTATPPPSAGDTGTIEPQGLDSDLPEADSAPRADAGPDRVVWMGDQEISLDGSASQGAALTYFWRQLSGTVDLQIQNPRAAQTAATGLAQEWPEKDATYEFELRVRDVYGQESVDNVCVTVKVAPSITVVPTPTRRLAWREGYLLAHFEAWKTNRTDDAEAFEIRSPGELTFHQLGGTAEYDIAPVERSSGFEYELTVLYREPESSTFLEFFVETPEHIPAILQFGVNWE
jgi:hypothetical protein